MHDMISTMNDLRRRGVRLEKHLDTRTIVLRDGVYYGTAADGAEVIIGSEGNEADIETYLANHPEPETW